MQKLLDGDGDVWVSWLMPTRVGVNISVLWVPITATRVVYRVVVPHASCGMDSNQPTHLRVGKTTNAHTHLFFPPEPSHTRACGRS